MSARACPGCDGPISRHATLCRGCRRRAIADGVHAILEPPPARPRSAGQNSAYHGKCGTLAQLELGAGAHRTELAQRTLVHKQRALAEASRSAGRTITSSKQLSDEQMSDLLDWLDAQIAAAGP